MSEAESPDLLSSGHRVTAEDVRALAGASTPTSRCRFATESGA